MACVPRRLLCVEDSVRDPKVYSGQNWNVFQLEEDVDNPPRVLCHHVVCVTLAGSMESSNPKLKGVYISIFENLYFCFHWNNTGENKKLVCSVRSFEASLNFKYKRWEPHQTRELQERKCWMTNYKSISLSSYFLRWIKNYWVVFHGNNKISNIITATCVLKVIKSLKLQHGRIRTKSSIMLVKLKKRY